MARARLSLLLKRLLPAFVLLGSAACRHDPDTRVVANEALQTIKLTKYLTLHAYPVAQADLTGEVPRLRVAGAELTCCVANSAPILADGTSRNDQALVLEFTNLPAHPVLTLTDPASAQPSGTLAWTAQTAEEPAIVTYSATIPAGQSCADGHASLAGFSIRPAQGDAPGEVRFAVVGDLLGDTQLGYQIIEEVRSRSPSFLILLGNLASGEDPATEVAEMATLFAQLSLPVYATAGYEDVSGGGEAAFLERFGPTSSDFLVHQIRFVLLDSADHTLAAAQFDWLDQTLDQGATLSLLFTHSAPFDPVDLRDRGFESHREAARLVALLRAHSVAAIFAGGLLSYVETSLAAIPTYLTGATGAEAFDSIGPHFLMVTADSSTAPPQVKVERIDLP